MPSWRSVTKIAESGSESRSVSQRYGSADPDPCQNVTDPQHYSKVHQTYSFCLRSSLFYRGHWLLRYLNAKFCGEFCHLNQLSHILNKTGHKILFWNWLQNRIRPRFNSQDLPLWSERFSILVLKLHLFVFSGRIFIYFFNQTADNSPVKLVLDTSFQYVSVMD